MESILQALVGILFTILVAAGSIYVCAPDFAQKYIDQWNGMSNTPSMNSAVKPTSGPSQTTGASDWDDVILVGGPKQQKKAGHKK